MRVIKVVLVLVMAVFLFGYLALFAGFTANLPEVINLRLNFQQNLLRLKFLIAPGKVNDAVDEIAPILVTGQDEATGEFFYSISGRFTDLDVDKGIIYLTGNDKKTYGLYVGQKRRGALVVPTKVIKTAYDPEQKLTHVERDDKLLVADDSLTYRQEFLPIGTQLSIVFKDNRLLNEVIKQAGGALNSGSSSIVQVAKYESN